MCKGGKSKHLQKFNRFPFPPLPDVGGASPVRPADEHELAPRGVAGVARQVRLPLRDAPLGRVGIPCFTHVIVVVRQNTSDR